MTLHERFRALHHGDDVLVMPNAWDAGSARLLAHLGFRAVATTGGGAAAARGVLDGGLDLATMLDYCAALVDAVDVPVSADLEDCFADDPDGVAETIRRAGRTGLAGVSIEDWNDGGVYDLGRAAERVTAAVDAAAGSLVVTARADNHFRGVDDLADTIARLQAYQEAGADVLYAPAIRTREQIRAVVTSVDRPVNVLAVPGVPPVAELADLGVRRVSTGASLAFRAYAALIDAATELRDTGTYDYIDDAARARSLAPEVFAPSRRP